MKKKNIEKICGNCRLFNPKDRRCMVIIMHDGQKINIPVDAPDPCFFENKFESIKETVKNNEIVKEKESFTPAEEIKEVKIWTEDPKTGQRSDKGIVKIEYDKDFFGKEEFLSDT